VAEPISFKYRAFLSYAHADTAWAKRLHRRLENFRIDKDLVGRTTAQGAVPATLRPIFRDREDFTAGHTLTDQTIAALDASAALIVLCSPASAKSHYVNEEIRLFKARHPERPVIPVIVDGTPGRGENECFPRALLFTVGPDGAITDRPEDDQLAADVRESGDGFPLAVAKVVARLIDLPTDEVFRRAERDRRRHLRIRNGVIAALAILAIAAVSSAAYARQQLMTNEAFLEATLRRVTDIVGAAVTQAERYYVPRAATLQMLKTAEGLFDDMARLGRPTARLQRQKAWMLIEFARNYEVLGDTTHRRERIEDAHRIMATLAETSSEDATALRDLSVAQNERGDLLISQGDLPGALAAFRDGLAIAERLAKAVPDNADWQRDLFLSLTKIGDVLTAQGNLAAALKSYRDGLAIAARLAKADPSAPRQRDLSVSYNKVGDLLAAQGDLDGALQSYRDGLVIREALTKTEPGNPNLQRDLAISQISVGDVLAALGRLADALPLYQASLAINERLASADAGNARWQRDLSVSYDKAGNMLALTGEFDKALDMYRKGLAIAESLAKSDPANTTSQRDLSVSYMKIGDVLGAQGDLAGAVRAYADSFAIRERLAKSDPENAEWQADLAATYRKLGRLSAALGKKDQAARLFKAGRDIMQALAAKSTRWAEALRGFDAEIAKLNN
jgi:tetratricopeptide (TPR) repeat protein